MSNLKNKATTSVKKVIIKPPAIIKSVSNGTDVAVSVRPMAQIIIGDAVATAVCVNMSERCTVVPLHDILTVPYRQFFPERGYIWWRRRKEVFYEDDVIRVAGQNAEYPVCNFPVGLVQYVKERLEQMGYGVILKDLSTDPNREPALVQQVSPVSAADGGLVKAVVRSRLGQVHVANQNDAALVTATLLNTFPDSRPIVLTATRDESQRLADRLTQLQNREWKFPNGESVKPFHMPIITAQLPGGGGLRHHYMVLLHGWSVVRSQRARETCSHSQHARRYAILEANEPARMSERERMRVAAMAGEIICQFDADRG